MPTCYNSVSFLARSKICLQKKKTGCRADTISRREWFSNTPAVSASTLPGLKLGVGHTLFTSWPNQLETIRKKQRQNWDHFCLSTKRGQTPN